MANRILGSAAGAVSVMALLAGGPQSANAGQRAELLDTGAMTHNQLEHITLELRDLAMSMGPMGGATIPARLGGVQILEMETGRSGSAPHSLYYTFPDGGALSYYSEQSENSSNMSAYESAADGKSNLSSYGWLFSEAEDIGSTGFTETFWEDGIQYQQGLTFYDDNFLRSGPAQAIVSEYRYSQSASATGYDVMEWQVRDNIQTAYSGYVDLMDEGNSTVREYTGSSAERTVERSVLCDSNSTTRYSYVGGYYYSAEVAETCDSDLTEGIDWYMESVTTSSYDQSTGDSFYGSSGMIQCLDRQHNALHYDFIFDEEANAVVFTDALTGDVSQLECAYMPG